MEGSYLAASCVLILLFSWAFSHTWRQPLLHMYFPTMTDSPGSYGKVEALLVITSFIVRWEKENSSPTKQGSTIVLL